MKNLLKYICRCTYYVIKAFKLSTSHEIDKGWFFLCKDIIQCHNKYYATFAQYTEFKMYSLSMAEKYEVGMRIKKNSTNEWREVYDNDWAFLNKWSQLKWESTMRRRVKRTKAYIKHYGLNKKCWFQYDVKIICEHNSIGKLKVGEHVLFARGCDIDYTGDLTIEDAVQISEGAKILTHNHDMNFSIKDQTHGCFVTPLVIKEDVWIGARAIIMPGVKEIGRGAIISSGAVVKSKVPPYAVLMGNPAKIVGFKYTPDEMQKHEADNYQPEKRTDTIQYEKLYNKYFLNRINDIKK